MPKPRTKEELLKLGQDKYNELVSLVHSFSDNDISKEFPLGTLNRNVRDVLAHLHHWHLLMLDWYSVGMNGKKPNMPAEGYTWQGLPALNREIRKKYQRFEIDEVRVLLNKSYGKVRKIIDSHTNEELFEKKRYNWTGTTSLGAYLISNTSSHYSWAIKLIKRSIK